MAIEYKNSSNTIHGTAWTDLLVVPTGKKAIVSTVLVSNVTDVISPNISLRKLEGSNATSLLSGTSIAVNSSLSALASKIVLNANEKLQGNFSGSGVDEYSGFTGPTTSRFNSWSSVGLTGFVASNFAQDSSGNIVSVGASGLMARSTDGGVTWTKLTNPTAGTAALRYVAFGNNIWVIAGASGTVFTSNDGITWTNVSHGLGTASLVFVTYLNGAFYIGGIGVIWRSTNGSTWTSVSTGYTVYDIVYNGTRFLARTDSTSIDNHLLTSTDGVTWTAVPSTGVLATGNYAGAIINIGSTFWLFVIDNTFNLISVFTSTDASTWTQRTDNAFVRAVASGTKSLVGADRKNIFEVNGAVYLTLGGNALTTRKILYTLDNGTTWTLAPGPYYRPITMIYNTKTGNKILIITTSNSNFYALDELDFIQSKTRIGDALVSYVEVTP